MSTKEKVKALADKYNTSVRTIQMFIAENRIPGAYAIKHSKRHAFLFSPELTKELEERYAGTRT